MEVNMSQKKLTGFLCAIFFTVTTFSQNLSLSEAISKALVGNEKIKQYAEKVKQKEFEDLGAWGNFMPVINIDGSYTHLNDPLLISLDPIRTAMIQMQAGTQVELANIYNLINTKIPLSDAQKTALSGQFTNKLQQLLPPFEKTLKEKDYKAATLTGIQPLFLGGKLLAAKKYATAEKDASFIELQKTTNEIISEVTISYIRVILLNEVIKTRESVLAGMLQHRNDANKLFEQGLIANYNLLRAEVAVAEAERNLITDQNNLEVAILALKHTIGILETEQINLTDSLTYNEYDTDIQTSLTNAYNSQPILKLLEQKKIAAEQNYNIARSAFLPQVFAFGKYEMYPQYLSAMEPRWAVGVQVKMNLFNGLKDYAKLQTASHLENEVNLIQIEAKKKIDLWVNKAVKDVNSTKVRYNKLDATLSLAEENLRLNEKRFQSGMGRSLEVIDARLSLEKVKIERLLTLFDYYKSLSDLHSAMGNPLDLLKYWNK